jgi:NitT/TauT family transport system substrate-binding protein
MALALALATAAPASAARAAELVAFKVGIAAPTVTVMPLYLGEAGGFYAKQGLKVEIISMEGGTRGVRALLSGEIQAMNVGLSPVVAANAQGADLRVIASSANTLPITIFAARQKDPPLPKGSTIGISTPGSETDIALSIALKALGLKREEMNITQIGGTNQRFAAMVAGRIDAAPLLEPATTAAKRKGFVPVYDLSAAKTPWIFDSLVVTNAYLQQHPPALIRFLMAYVDGAYWGLTQESEAKQVIAQRFETQDPMVIDATYAEFKRLMPLDAIPSIEGARNVIENLRQTDVKVASQRIEDYVDPSMIEGLRRMGMFLKWHRLYDAK